MEQIQTIEPGVETLNAVVEDETDEFTGEDTLTSIIFVGGTGGPHYEFRFHLHTQKLTFHYWTWFYSDLYETGLTGAQEDTLKEVLRNYFDAYYALGVQL